MFFNYDALSTALKTYKGAEPFDHCVIDNFLDLEIAKKVESEFPDFSDPRWFFYDNEIENKKALNDWNCFPKTTYWVLRSLIQDDFIRIISEAIGDHLFQDPGLHGGGWHIHGPGGNLNPHYDYSIHPKVGLQRKVNIIIYLSSQLLDEHGGHLGLWSQGDSTNEPGLLVKSIQPKFNRAVIFDTTQNSWHGMSTPLVQPEGIYRKSLAVYYLTNPPVDADPRERALFAPRLDQKGDDYVRELIRRRADSTSFSSVYVTKKK